MLRFLLLSSSTLLTIGCGYLTSGCTIKQKTPGDSPALMSDSGSSDSSLHAQVLQYLPDDKNSKIKVKRVLQRPVEYDQDTGMQNFFTQGLVFYQGVLIEGTGMSGHSRLQVYSIAHPRLELSWQSEALLGRSEDDCHRDNKVSDGVQWNGTECAPWGEGVVVWGSQLMQLTWQQRRAIIYQKAEDGSEWAEIERIDLPVEGWGATFDGESLVVSDGTHRLYFLKTEMDALKSASKTNWGKACRYMISVQDAPPGRGEDKAKVPCEVPTSYDQTKLSAAVPPNPWVVNLNELEFVDGLIYANVYHTDLIARIDPKSGIVHSWLDLKTLFTREEYEQFLPDIQQRSRFDSKREQSFHLNGIAYDNDSGLLYLSGKQWPAFFELSVPPT